MAKANARRNEPAVVYVQLNQWWGYINSPVVGFLREENLFHEEKTILFKYLKIHLNI